MAEVNIDVAKEASVQAVNTTAGTVNTSVQAVNTKVGTSSDTASNTPTTLFAGIKGLIAWFTGTWTAARAGYVDSINTNTAVNNTASKTGTLSQKESYGIGLLENATFGLSALKTAVTGGNIPVIKSIQRLTLNYAASITTATANISTVNINKTIVIINGNFAFSGVVAMPYLSSLTATSVTIDFKITGNSTAVISCQVIEFY